MISPLSLAILRGQRVAMAWGKSDGSADAVAKWVAQLKRNDGALKQLHIMRYGVSPRGTHAHTHTHRDTQTQTHTHTFARPVSCPFSLCRNALEMQRRCSVVLALSSLSLCSVPSPLSAFPFSLSLSLLSPTTTMAFNPAMPPARKRHVRSSCEHPFARCFPTCTSRSFESPCL